MQTIYQDEVERGIGRRTDLVDFIICVRRSSGYMEREYYRRFGGRRSQI